MREKEVRGLMEAYSQVHAPQELTEEQVWEEVENWVNTLIEEGYDLSDYTWEEMYEAYIEEAPMTAFQAAGGQAKLNQLNKGLSPRSTKRATASSIEKLGQDNLFKAGGGNAAIAKGPTRRQNLRGGGSRQVPTRTRQDVINRGTVAAAAKPAAPSAKPTAPVAKPTAPVAKPTAAKPTAPTATAKPTTPAKPAGSAMDQWAKANPKLAAAKAERDRTRGTSATTNPLMKDMKSRLPAPKSPAPSTAKTGFDLAKKGVNLASDVDLFDIVKGYLLDEGYAESEGAAMVIMVNMSEGWKESILESCGVELELDESQYARENPEKYERSPEAREGRRRRSGINDPDTGINSDKFKAFMAQQMGGKKKKG